MNIRVFSYLYISKYEYTSRIPPGLRPVSGRGHLQKRKRAVSDELSQTIGRVVPAPENFLDADKLELARKARRSFMGKALAMAASKMP